MDQFRIVWDINKSLTNLTKHGVSFDEAMTVFYDEKGRELYDPIHSELEEDRFLFIGLSNKLRLLLVCYCYRENDLTIRIISARKATKNESKYYTGV
jgi:uncharacterized DUF497 family protein